MLAAADTEIAEKEVLQLEMYDNLADLNEEQNRLEEAMTIHRIMGTLPLAPLHDISAHLAKAKMGWYFSTRRINGY